MHPIEKPPLVNRIQIAFGLFLAGLNHGESRLSLSSRPFIYATVEDFPKALSAFRSALELDDMDANTWFLLGRSYFLSHQPGMARAPLENALRLNPQVVEIYSHLARTLARLGESTKAETVFIQGIEKNR